MLIEEVVDEDFDGDWFGVTPIGRAEDLFIGRILSGFDVVVFIGVDEIFGGVWEVIVEGCLAGRIFVVGGEDISCGRED